LRISLFHLAHTTGSDGVGLSSRSVFLSRRKGGGKSVFRSPSSWDLDLAALTPILDVLPTLAGPSRA
jgi:hypothetical protein